MSIVQVYSQSKPTERAISPASIDAVLAALGYGASGPGLQQLMQLYGFTDRQQFLQLLQRITQAMSGQDIRGGNAIFFNRPYSVVHPEYYQAVANYMYLSQSDFSNPAQAAQEINGWIERNSGLPDVIPMMVFQNPDLRMIVANALWFKDDWVNKFQKSNTQADNFTRQNGQVARVPMMYQQCSLDWYDDGRVTAVKLDFEHGSHAEFVMGLPGNTAITGNLQYQHGDVQLSLPRFEAEQNIDLMPLLRVARLEGLFNDGFGFISLRNDLGVSSGAQKLLARFDEQGAEVKVATYAGIALPMCAMPTQQPKVIRFDRPFHYRILKNGISIIEGWYDAERIGQLPAGSSTPSAGSTGVFQLPTF